ncbi:hypothetical protein [Bacillus paranthracis]|nr:hypothetical protein [Bacillus paranthracis]
MPTTGRILSPRYFGYIPSNYDSSWFKRSSLERLNDEESTTNNELERLK